MSFSVITLGDLVTDMNIFKNVHQSLRPISFFGESSQFLGLFGRYSRRGNGALYERSIYLELANATAGDDFRRDLKSEKTIIEKPLLNICLNRDSETFNDIFRSEKLNHQDGHVQNFFIQATWAINI